MIPVIALVGRPNVGKSTLFNCLTKSRAALVADKPGLTRDRIYGEGEIDDRSFIVVDTGGIGGEKDDVSTLMAEQTQKAIQESDQILFIVDARVGLTPSDQVIAKKLRASGKPVLLLANKCEGLKPEMVLTEFYSLGLGKPIAIAAAHKQGIISLMELILEKFPKDKEEDSTAANKIKIAIVGRPNVGKSTLINRMLGEERVVVYDAPGTTRDSIYIPYERHGKHYILIDTAGVRRRHHVKEVIEKFSVVKSLQAIESCNVAIMVIDARENITEQDLHIIGFILETGKALVIAVNKWDDLPADQREKIKNELSRRLVFVDFVKIKFISALHGTGVGELYPLVDKAFTAAHCDLSTPVLTRLLEKAVATHQPPMVNGRRIKLRYAHAGGHNPPCIVIHGKQTRSLPDSYRRFLESFYRKALNLVGTPIRIELRDSENPFVS